MGIDRTEWGHLRTTRRECSRARRGPTRARVRVVAAIAFAFATLTAGAARAQLHWDASAHAGVTQRFTSGSARPNPDPGPMGSVTLHLAVLPFVRGGVYVTYDGSKTANGDLRHFVAGGLRAKLVSPFPERPFRTWLFFGTGYTRAFDSVASGGFVEIPVGVGISYEVRKPYQLSLELGGRFGFGFHGAAHDAAVPGRFVGNEFAAVFATAGITFDR